MNLDLQSYEFQFLLRQFESGNVILFAGAGFSTDAKNRRNQPPPLTRGLCEALCDRCGWSYSGEDLGTVYDVAQKHLGIAGLTELLRLLYEDCTPATWQQQIAQLIWYRTYTTNIDDVLENSYRGPCKQKLILRVSTDPVQDHDQWYETLQCVHLHGSIKRTDARFTFSQEDYADQTASSSPWYQALADDMQVKTVLFVGSQLNEPALYHYLRMRSKRDPGVSEPRAKAYLVIKSISPIKLRQLRGQNIVVFEVSAAEFFEQAAGEILSRVPDRIKLLENRYPHQIATLRAPQFSTQKELLRQFDLVSDLMQAQPSVSQRSGFYQGAEPTWSDIHGNLDAEREITGSLTEQLGVRPSISLARFWCWVEFPAGDLLVRQRQGSGGRSRAGWTNTAWQQFLAPRRSLRELFEPHFLLAIHGRGCASSICCASGKSTPIRRAPSPTRARETLASRAPV